MRLRPVRGPWRAVAVASVLVSSVGWLAGCAAGGGVSSDSAPTGGPGGTTVRVLQMNLCDSGIAGCYSGRSVGIAEALIQEHRPDLVTVNEVCREDVRVLERAMSASVHGAGVAWAFKPADDRATNAPYLCLNGEQFGDAVLAVVRPEAHGSHTYGGVYPVQERNDPEERIWVCLDLPGQFAGCTTHPASTSPSVALIQCRYLLTTAVPRMTGRDGGDPIILGADLNLAASGSPSPQSCLPPGYQRTDDGALQDVVVSPGVGVGSRSIIDMRGTTDHPGLLVEATLPRA